jgi:hypothetical protein
MAGLEAVLRITAKDDAGPALAKVKEQIASLDKSIAVFDKMSTAVGKVSKSTDPMLVAINASVRAMTEARSAATELAAGLETMGGGAEAAAGGQRTLGEAVMSTTRLMIAQGTEAVRVAEKIAVSQKKAATEARRTREGGGIGGMAGGLLPLIGAAAGAKAIEAGASIQDEIARLKAAGATDKQIGQARSDFSDFSKTHSGVFEAEYLAGFRDARVIAPGEQFEMARLGATYRAAARNSGLSTSENDVGNVLRIMDELGLKSNPEREDFLNNFIKSQQAFGSQISTETALAAYRNAKQSIYGWSPEFRKKYFPTLLQSSGQQGGTEMMTALNNFIGQHMQQSELRALASAGFVQNKDLIYNKVGDVKGLKPGAQLFEADTFKSNIAQWAWDFHDTFMGRKGATEDKFSDLIARMPRNMAALIAFLNHNRGRIQRDAATLDLPVGLAAAKDSSLAQNPGAGLAALGSAITQFGAEVTGPAVKAAGPILLALTQDIQAAAAVLHKAAKDHPVEATVGSAGAIAGAGWLGLKALGWVKGWLGLGGGATGGATAAGGGLGRILGVNPAAALALPLALSSDTGPAHPSSETNAEALRRWIWGAPGPMQLPGASPASPVGTVLEPYRATTLGPGRNIHSPSTGPYADYPPQAVSVSGQAQVDHEIRVRIEPSPLLTAIVDQARQQSETTVPLIGDGNGRMDSDAGPHRSGGIGHR